MKESCSMLDRICDTIEKYHMLEAGNRVLLGVSGGPDSMCLLSVLLKLRERYAITLGVVHVHHGLRGEADREANFVETYCNDAGVPCLVEHFDATSYAAERKRSVEEASRDYRYACFERIAREKGYGKIALAHQQNDLAETMLFRMARGTGVKGLRGIPPVRPLSEEKGAPVLIRPLYEVNRAEVEAYLANQGIGYMTDASNQEDCYARNRIRNLVLPELAKVNPGAVEHFAELSEMAYQYWEYVDRVSREKFLEIAGPLSEDAEYLELHPDSCRKEEGYTISIAALRACDPVIQTHILHRVLVLVSGQMRDLEQKHVQAVLALAEKETGKRINLPYRVTAVKRRKRLWVYKAEESHFPTCKSSESTVE